MKSIKTLADLPPTPYKSYRIAFALQQQIARLKQEMHTTMTIKSSQILKRKQITEISKPQLEPLKQITKEQLKYTPSIKMRSRTVTREERYDRLMSKNYDSEFKQIRHLLKQNRRVCSLNRKVKFYDNI